jgi:hypothetical protein
MNMKSILLGGAMAMALSGAGFAQQATTDAQTGTTQGKIVHHTHHRIVASTATRDLNLQQLRYEYSQGYAQGFARGAQSAQGSAPTQNAALITQRQARAFSPMGYPDFSAARSGGGPLDSRSNGGQNVAR